MKTPPHILALNRLSALIGRYNALPDWIIERLDEAFERWEKWIDEAYFSICETEKVTEQQKQNIKAWEGAMSMWERIVRAHDEETSAEAGKESQMAETKTKKKSKGKVGKETDKRTEKDVARERLEDDIIAEARSLVPEAISASLKGKNVSLTVKVSLRPNKKKGGFDYTVSGGTSAKAAEKDRIEISNQVVLV